MKALVIGYGSIGLRHARVLSELGCDTAVFSGRNIDFPLVFDDIESALLRHQPDYLVIANSTKEHYETVETLVATGYAGQVLVEKPLFQQLRSIPENDFQSLSVAYNLRFHPLLQQLQNLLEHESVISVQAYVGQYLPDWRPGRDYRSSYSARSTDGGGVLRDLSHELDYLVWLFGDWIRVAAIGGHMSSLEIDSDDIFVLLMQTARCPAVSVQLSYLDRFPRRRVTVNTQRHSIEVDLVSGTLQLDGKSESITIERDFTYRAMHLNAMAGDSITLCTAEEALSTLELIEAAELSSQKKEWIKR